MTFWLSVPKRLTVFNFYLILKRIFDVFFSFVLFICAIPILICLCILIYFSLCENPIFLQRRHGYRCKPFILPKLKTMRSLVAGQEIKDHLRVTRLTAYIRQLRLDELPQLICIFIGDMSFVGPRPLPIEYTLLSKNSLYAMRYNVKPGILGLAQIYGGERLAFNHRLKLDLIYIKNCSVLLDVFIVARTVRFFLGNLLKKPSNGGSLNSLPKFN